MSLRIPRLAAALALPFLLAAAKPAAKPKTPKPADPSGPNLQESVAFLKEKVETYGNYTYEVEKTDAPPAKGKVTGSLKIGSFDEKACVLELRRQVALETTVSGESPYAYNEFSEITLRVPLKDLDATKVSLDPLPTTFRKVYSATSKTDTYLQVSLTAKGDKKPIKLTEKRKIEDLSGATTRNENATLTDLVATTYILFSDAEIAERAQKALVHAVELCQKKKEAF